MTDEFAEFTYRRTGDKTSSPYQRNERLKHWVWLAAHGSTSALYVLERMDKETKRLAWQFSAEDIKARLKAVLNAPSS